MVAVILFFWSLAFPLIQAARVFNAGGCNWLLGSSVQKRACRGGCALSDQERRGQKMYYRVAIQVDASPTWQWKSTVLSEENHYGR